MIGMIGMASIIKMVVMVVVVIMTMMTMTTTTTTTKTADSSNEDDNDDEDEDEEDDDDTALILLKHPSGTAFAARDATCCVMAVRKNATTCDHSCGDSSLAGEVGFAQPLALLDVRSFRLQQINPFHDS